MTLDEYQKQAIKTDTFGGKVQPIDSHAFLSKLLGLVGESGEIAEKFKKILRDKNGKLSPSDKQEIAGELGDLLWYVSSMCVYLDLKLETVAADNLSKVHSRKRRGKTSGSGDNR